MLLIRQAQLHVFTEQQLVSFDQDMVRHLRQTYAHQTDVLMPVEPLAFVAQVRERCFRSGIQHRGDVSVMAEIMLQVGLDFENFCQPQWARQILAHACLPAATKVQFLNEKVHRWTGGRVVVRQ